MKLSTMQRHYKDIVLGVNLRSLPRLTFYYSEDHFTENMD